MVWSQGIEAVTRSGLVARSFDFFLPPSGWLVFFSFFCVDSNWF